MLPATMMKATGEPIHRVARCGEVSNTSFIGLCHSTFGPADHEIQSFLVFADDMSAIRSSACGGGRPR
jgi:hypothetical protein